MYNKFNSLSNNLLIAMPKLSGTYFADSVVLLCEHDEAGAMGLVINRPLDLNVAKVLAQMNIKNDKSKLKHIPVLSGGPLKSDKGFVLHYNEECDKDSENNINEPKWKTSLALDENLTITTSDDIMQAIADNKNPNPNPYLVALGYCSWEAGQLEEELVNNDWLFAPIDLDVIFNVPHIHRWRECAYNIGIYDIHSLSTYGGKA